MNWNGRMKSFWTNLNYIPLTVRKRREKYESTMERKIIRIDEK